jgi:hypothetical protein
MFSCKICTKIFKSKYNLERHDKSCKGQPIITDFRCDYCFKYLCKKQSLEEHKEICKVKKNKEEILETKLKLKEIENELLKEQLKAAPKVVNNITNITNNITNNKTVNKYILLYGMEPLDLSQKRFDNIIEDKYTYMTHVNCKLVPEIILKFLSNEQDKVVGLLTDENRMRIKCIDDKLKIQTFDPQSFVDLCKASKPMKSKTEEYIDKNNPEHKEGVKRGTDLRKDASMLISRLKEHKHKFLKKNDKRALAEIEDEDETKIIFIEE